MKDAMLLNPTQECNQHQVPVLTIAPICQRWWKMDLVPELVVLMLIVALAQAMSIFPLAVSAYQKKVWLLIMNRKFDPAEWMINDVLI